MAVPNPGDELSSIDFSKLIGGPLIAVVNAQAQAALASVNFVKQVGFKPKDTSTTGKPEEQQFTGEPATVTFKYLKEGRETDLTIPLLAMLPVPYIRVEETDINFLAKINSVEHQEVDQDVNVDGRLDAKAGCLWASAKLSVSTAYQRKEVSGSNISRDYSLDVKVKAVQDEMPAGLNRVLGILETQIKETPLPLTSTNMDLKDVSGKKTTSVDIIPVLTDSQDNPLSNKSIDLTDDKNFKDTQVTDNTGKATFKYTITDATTLTAAFKGDSQYGEIKKSAKITQTP